MAGDLQLFAKNSAGETCLLQLSSFDPVKLTLSVAEQNPFVPSSSYSQTFRIPGQGSNVAFFEDVYSVNGSSFDAGKAADAWILSDGFLFSVGNLILKSVVRNEKYARIEYEVLFLGDITSFSASVGDDYMNQIDTSEINHPLTYANVTGSWGATGGATGGLKNGNVLYPLCEWGYTYDGNNFPTLNTVSVGYAKGSTGAYGSSFTSGPSGALLLAQFKPATRIKWIWDKIFEDADFSYSSEFLNSDMFDNIYMISDSVERPAQPDNQPVGICNVTARSFKVPRTGSFFTQGGKVTVPYNNKVVDLDNVFNATTFTFRALITGDYVFKIAGRASFNDRDPNASVGSTSFLVNILRNGTSIFTSSIYTTQVPRSNKSNFPYAVAPNITRTVSLTQGDLVTVQVEQLAFSTDYANYTDWTFQCIDSPEEVIVSSYFPGEGSLRKIDFIKGITKAFNLVWEPDTDSQRKFIIEPWIDWIQGGKKKDWTEYLDGSKDLIQTPVFLDQPRILKFTGENDLDVQNELFQSQYKVSWLYRQFNSGINIIKGETETKVPFAGTPLESIPANGTQYPNWIVPTMAKLQPGEPGQPNAGRLIPTRPRPRLVFYNGKVSTPVNWYLMNNNLGTSSTLQNKYPLVSEFFQLGGLQATGGNVITPPNNNDLFNLSLDFQVKPPLWSSAVTLPSLTPSQILQTPDLYTTYWDEFVNWIYDPYNRKVTAYFRLDAKQIQELKFNDKIWVKDCWYFVDKIYDYPVGEIANVKVDLIKCPTPAIPKTTIAATGATSGVCKSVSLCYTALLTESAVSYTYVDCNSNLQSVSLVPMSCATVCMFYPPNNPLPAGWTAAVNGGCSGPNQEFVDEGGFVEFVLSATGATAWSPNTNVAVYASADGPTGTYLPMQYYLWSSMDEIQIAYNVPYGNWVRIEQQQFDSATGAATGGTGYFQEVSLYINGATAATQTQTTYSPIVLDFTSPIDIGGTYGATAAIQYPPLPPS